MLFPNKKRALLRENSLNYLRREPSMCEMRSPNSVLLDALNSDFSSTITNDLHHRLLPRPKYPTDSNSKFLVKTSSANQQLYAAKQEAPMTLVLRLSRSMKQLKKVSKLKNREHQSEKLLSKKEESQNVQEKQRQWVLDNRYRVGEQIGKGSYGIVYKALDSVSGQYVAVKEFLKGSMHQQRFQIKLNRQATIHSKLHHPNIVKFHRLALFNGRSFLVMDYCDGINLKEYIKKKKSLEEEFVKRIFKNVVEAIQYCHSKRVAHRDIKLENILISDNGEQIKLTDFGFSSTLGHTEEILRSYCGTPLYMAPEITLKKPYNPFKSDIWALGVFLVVLATGRHPFASKQENALFNMIQKGQPTFFGTVSDQLRSFAVSLLKKNPSERLDIKGILQSQWLKEKSQMI